MELIQGFNQSMGMTVLMVTHEQALAEKYAGRMVHLADGKLVDDISNVAASMVSSGPVVGPEPAHGPESERAPEAGGGTQ